SNDYFTNASVLTGTNGSVSTNNLRATREVGEPNHAGLGGERSIWYRWTAPNSGYYVFDTMGSSFDTLLAVYTGASITNLTPVASDNDSGGLGTSRLSFNATANTTYRIAVAGYGFHTDFGNVVLHWSRPSLPIFLVQPVNTNVVVSSSVTLPSIA